MVMDTPECNRRSRKDIEKDSVYIDCSATNGRKRVIGGLP